MKRRDFIAALGGAAAWPLTVHAQQANKLATIGFLGDDASSWSPWTARFVERLESIAVQGGMNNAPQRSKRPTAAGPIQDTARGTSIDEGRDQGCG